MSYSLRQRLILTTLCLSLVSWLVTLAIVVGVSWYETNQVYDDALEESARIVLTMGASMTDVQASDAVHTDIDRHRRRVRVYYQLFDQNHTMLRRSADTPERYFVDCSDQACSPYAKYYTKWLAGDLWRVYVLTGSNGFTVQTAHEWEDRTELLLEMVGLLALALAGLMVLLGILIWLAIRRLLLPLEAVARHIAEKSPTDLLPIAQQGQARELQPVLSAFNTVLERLASALDRERRFTADAAHELRTPLAGLSMKLQLMHRTQAGTSTIDLKAALAVLQSDVERCTGLVENLLTLARLDPAQPDGLKKERVDLKALLEETLRRSQSAAIAKQIRFTLHGPAVYVLGQPALLSVALRNVVDNAIRYGRLGGIVRIDTSGEGPDAVCIAVSDNGPGVAPALRQQLGQRFFRVRGSGAWGSGLGLSIVVSIMALHRGALRFEPGIDGKGLKVVLCFVN